MTSSTAVHSDPAKPRRRIGMKVIAPVIIAVIAGIVLGVTLRGNGGGRKNSSSSSQSNIASSLGDGNNDATSSSSQGEIVTDPTSSPTTFLRATANPASPSTDALAAGSPPPPPTDAPTTSVITPVIVDGQSDSEVLNNIVSRTTSNGIDYLTCQSGGSSSSSSNEKQIVLLHGVAFSNDIWTADDNMLDSLCDGSETVVALDLSFGATYQDLMDTLDALREPTDDAQPILTTEPVTLVTPSTSASTMINWMTNGNINDIPNYISEWVAVSPVGLALASDDEVSALQTVPGLSIVAITGNQDFLGGLVTSRLVELAGATVIELEGGSMAYLQSPVDFVQTILTFDPSSKPETGAVMVEDAPGIIVPGTTSNNVDYLRCRSGNNEENNSNTEKQILLLHSAFLSNDIWTADGILDSLCAGSESVVALDLPFGATYQDLIDTLDALRETMNYDIDDPQPILTTAPVTLVTPSTSASTMINWMTTGTVNDIPNYISEWVAVSPVGLTLASDDEVSALQTVPGLSILAITGDGDLLGGLVTSRLVELAGATAIELVGGITAYLQSPVDFVQTILTFDPSSTPETGATMVEDGPGIIVPGTTSNNVNYLRCRSGNNDNNSNTEKQILLLHGVTSQNDMWQADGMLDSFCAGSDIVVALDLPFGATHQDLIDVLDAMMTSDPPILTGPVTLVTPATSAFTITDWMATGNVNDIPNYISEWVPVAPVGLALVSDEDVSALQSVSGLSILAINGNNHWIGGLVSSRLAELAGAVAVELEGGAMVYSQSPDAFVQTILEFNGTPSSIAVGAPPAADDSSPPATTTTPAAPVENVMDSSVPGTIVSGTTSNNVNYLSCTSPNSNNNGKQIVLLNSGAFSSMETWLTSGVLESFCAGSANVVALDLSSLTGYQGLIDELEALKSMNPYITASPVTLVTPSASGRTMIDWMVNGDITTIPEYISEWVPVAPGSLVLASDDQVSALQNVSGLRILAINGNLDFAGRLVSSRLEELAGATTVELGGRHAVYLQSPDDFVQTILDF